jgi:hypothetical protein
MMVLLEIKESLKIIYARYAVIANALVKFLLSLCSVCILNNSLGFMTILRNPAVVIVIALVCAFLPYGAISIVLAAVMLAHIHAVSFEITLLTAVFLIIIALLYYSFQPGDSIWLILTPFAFLLRVPFVIAVLAGLSGPLTGAIPVCCGVWIYYMIQYVRQNAGVLTNDASVDITQKYVQLIRALITNREMFIFIIACALGILIVNLVRRLSVDYAWIIAIALGLVGQMAAVFGGDFLFDVAVPLQNMVVGLIASVVIAGLYHFFVFAVDYTRTEYTQFEDDDYVYYVKAVPKVAVSKTDVKVQRINNPRRVQRTKRQNP